MQALWNGWYWLLLLNCARQHHPVPALLSRCGFRVPTIPTLGLVQGATGNFTYLFDLSFWETEQVSE